MGDFKAQNKCQARDGPVAPTANRQEAAGLCVHRKPVAHELHWSQHFSTANTQPTPTATTTESSEEIESSSSVDTLGLHRQQTPQSMMETNKMGTNIEHNLSSSEIEATFRNDKTSEYSKQYAWPENSTHYQVNTNMENTEYSYHNLDSAANQHQSVTTPMNEKTTMTAAGLSSSVEARPSKNYHQQNEQQESPDAFGKTESNDSAATSSTKDKMKMSAAGVSSSAEPKR